MGKYTAIEIANWYIERATADGEVLTNLKIQKLLHIANGWALCFFDEPLFNDKIEAWPYGPVVPSVYKEFKHYGAGSVEQTDFAPNVDEQTKKVLESVWRFYGGKTAITLVALTHKENSPWSQVYRGGVGKGLTISNEVIKKHYDELASAQDNQSKVN